VKAACVVDFELERDLLQFAEVPLLLQALEERFDLLPASLKGGLRGQRQPQGRKQIGTGEIKLPVRSVCSFLHEKLEQAIEQRRIVAEVRGTAASQKQLSFAGASGEPQPTQSRRSAFPEGERAGRQKIGRFLLGREEPGERGGIATSLSKEGLRPGTVFRQREDGLFL